MRLHEYIESYLKLSSFQVDLLLGFCVLIAVFFLLSRLLPRTVVIKHEFPWFAVYKESEGSMTQQFQSRRRGHENFCKKIAQDGTCLDNQ